MGSEAGSRILSGDRGVANGTVAHYAFNKALALIALLLTVAVVVYLAVGVSDDAAVGNGEITVGDKTIDITGAADFVSPSEAERNGWGFCSNDPLLKQSDVYVSAESAVLCTSEGRLIYRRNAEERLPMASITKVMTALVVLERVQNIDSIVKITSEAVGTEGSSIYLKLGDEITVRDLLYALMLASANDSAVALAVYVAETEQAFAELMNQKAIQLGMADTCFKNPHGLSCEGHYTTAVDYAKLMSYALDDPSFMEIIGTAKRTLSVNGEPRYVVNHNRLLYSCKGMLGGKTGYTVASGRTLVTACERNGVTLICVTLNASDDWNDHRTLYDKGFEKVRAERFSAGDLYVDIDVTGGGEISVRAVAACDLKLLTADGENITFVYRSKHFLYAPIAQGQQLGELWIYINDVKVGEVPLVAESNVAARNGKKSRALFGT